jgi:hypothetical protein
MRTKFEHDAITGEITERPYTDEENAQADKDEAQAKLEIVNHEHR